MYGFDNVGKKIYLKEAGLHENAKFISLAYGATEQYEYFDIDLETIDGKHFRERTFGPDISKVYPREMYKNGVKAGMETKEEALERAESEVSRKLYHLASCFCDRETLQKSISKVSTFKELVDETSKIIGEPANNINFLTIWKNKPSTQKSNLIIAERIRWCEPYVEGGKVSIKLNAYQLGSQMTELYPYQGNKEEATGTETLIPEEVGQPDDLPF